MASGKKNCSKRPKLALLTHKGHFYVLIVNKVMDCRYDCCWSVNLKSGRVYLFTDRQEKIKLDRGDEHLLHVELRRYLLNRFWDSLKRES